jgi:hypothetical protein
MAGYAVPGCRPPVPRAARRRHLRELPVAFKLKSYESQSLLSVLLALVGGVAALGAVGVMARGFDKASFYVNYSSRSMFLPTLAGALLVGLAAAVIGFFIALNSAGQKRNTRSRLAWQGFFLNALVLTIVLLAGVFFYFTRNAIH